MHFKCSNVYALPIQETTDTDTKPNLTNDNKYRVPVTIKGFKCPKLRTTRFNLSILKQQLFQTRLH